MKKFIITVDKGIAARGINHYERYGVIRRKLKNLTPILSISIYR